MSSPVLEFACPLAHGVHARPATALAALAGRYAADIRLVNRRNGREASLKSVLALLSADIRAADPCAISATGQDAAAALDALRRFVAEELPRCDDDAVTEPAAGAPVPRSLAELAPRCVGGRGIGTGVGIGSALVIAGPQFSEVLLAEPGRGAETEWQRVAAARAALLEDYAAELATHRGAEAAVLNAHVAILRDEEYAARLRAALFDAAQPVSAARAIADTVGHFDAILGATGNRYLRERALDVQDVSLRLLRRIYGEAAVAAPAAPDAPVVVVAAELAPSAFVALNKGHLQGLVLESGGSTSHTVILARAAGIPLVVDAPGAVAFARSAAGPLVADASAGLLVDGADAGVLAWYERERAKCAALEARFERYREAAGSTADGRRIEIAVNVASVEEAARAFAAGAEGIGLFRTEALFMDRAAPPAEEEQLAAYRAVLEHADGRPVVVRTFDIGGDKPVPWLETAAEPNPFLGVRGVRVYPHCPDACDAQLAALLRAAVHGDLRIMVPMVTTVEELRWVRARIAAQRERLREAGTVFGEPQLGVMVEVPAAAFAIDRLAEHCDFISIGSNDLAQYFLACDRGNPAVRELYAGCHPSFLRLLGTVVAAARAHGLRIAVCGELAGDASMLPVFAGLGVHELSMAAPLVTRAKAALAALDSAACRMLVGELEELDGAEAVAQRLREFAGTVREAPLFDAALIELLPHAASKADAIRHLVVLAHLDERVDSAAAVEEAVWQREDVFSTGLGFGIAVPHCKSAAVRHNSLCVARLAEPVDWQSRDGTPVDTVLLLLIRQADAGDAHLRIFAQLARRIMHEEFRTKLRQCASPGEVVACLRQALEAA